MFNLFGIRTFFFQKIKFKMFYNLVYNNIILKNEKKKRKNYFLLLKKPIPAFGIYIMPQL